MTSEKVNYWLLDDVIRIVQRCEAIQDDPQVSESTRRNEKINAYEDIRDLIKGVRV